MDTPNGPIDIQLQCPVPLPSDTVQLAHGGGGRAMQQLIQHIFLKAFHNPLLAPLHDGATIPLEAGTVAVTTDSYVIHPLIFPGGDIGSLAVHGTINDLAMCGAHPRYLSVAFILEEGLRLDTLETLVASMARAAAAAGVHIVTGDTKVVDRGKGDGVFITTTGIGIVPAGISIGPQHVAAGDAILLSGDLGSHGLAVMSVRDHLSFAGDIVSDSAPLHDVIADLEREGIVLHCLRDLTRGGLASALHELMTASGLAMAIDESTIPVREPVRGACELLGLDPLYVANEGRFVAYVPATDVDRALTIMRRHEVSSQAVQIGSVRKQTPPLVTLTTTLGTTRILDLLSGEQLPRIC